MTASSAGLGRHRALLGQLVRYGITGVLGTIVNVAIYWVLRDRAHWNPNLAWTAGFVAAVITGYVIHSRWSFRGHGSRDNPLRTTTRFIAVSLVSFALNSFWVWLLVQHLGLPTWAPTPLAVGVTPLVVFALNRQWVFG